LTTITTGDPETVDLNAIKRKLAKHQAEKSKGQEHVKSQQQHQAHNVGQCFGCKNNIIMSTSETIIDYLPSDIGNEGKYIQCGQCNNTYHNRKGCYSGSIPTKIKKSASLAIITHEEGYDDYPFQALIAGNYICAICHEIFEKNMLQFQCDSCNVYMHISCVTKTLKLLKKFSIAELKKLVESSSTGSDDDFDNLDHESLYG